MGFNSVPKASQKRILVALALPDRSHSRLSVQSALHTLPCFSVGTYAGFSVLPACTGLTVHEQGEQPLPGLLQNRSLYHFRSLKIGRWIVHSSRRLAAGISVKTEIDSNFSSFYGSRFSCQPWHAVCSMQGRILEN